MSEFNLEEETRKAEADEQRLVEYLDKNQGYCPTCKKDVIGRTVNDADGPKPPIYITICRDCDTELEQ